MPPSSIGLSSVFNVQQLCWRQNLIIGCYGLDFRSTITYNWLVLNLMSPHWRAEMAQWKIFFPCWCRFNGIYPHFWSRGIVRILTQNAKLLTSILTEQDANANNSMQPRVVDNVAMCASVHPGAHSDIILNVSKSLHRCWHLHGVHCTWRLKDKLYDISVIKKSIQICAS